MQVLEPSSAGQCDVSRVTIPAKSMEGRPPSPSSKAAPRRFRDSGQVELVLTLGRAILLGVQCLLCHPGRPALCSQPTEPAVTILLPGRCGGNRLAVCPLLLASISAFDSLTMSPQADSTLPCTTSSLLPALVSLVRPGGIFSSLCLGVPILKLGALEVKWGALCDTEDRARCVEGQISIYSCQNSYVHGVLEENVEFM